ncbi:DGQHR domain-containing protein [Candidatus Parcubacteria bacterium]|nr:DGQHR domain-containing protein [Candidatus Parcubacteria bacterium]
MRSKQKSKSPTKIGNAFHDKIERLFSKCGFKIEYSDYNKPGADIVASFGDTRILIQCKKSESEGKLGLSDLIDSYATKVRTHHASRAVIATSGIKIPANKLVLHKKEKVAVWDENIVSYYNDLANKIGEYTKYQILSDLDIHKKFEDDILIPALLVKQFDKNFFITKLPVSWIIRSSYVLRRIRTGDTKNYQRILSASRVKVEIPDHLNDEGLIPNSVILVSKDPLVFKKGHLTLSSETGGLWIMDGQHRIYSFANVRNEEVFNRFEIPCIIFDGDKTPKREQAQIFVDINQNAKPVKRALTLELKESFGLSVERGVKLVRSLQKLDFIKNRVRMYAEKSDTTKKNTISFVTLATNQATETIFESVSVPRKYSDKAEEFKLKKAQGVFKNFYKALFIVFKREWNDPDRYVFSTDKGVRALAHLLLITLKSNTTEPNGPYFVRIFRALKNGQPMIQTEFTRRAFAGEAGAKELAEKWAKSIQSGGIADFAPNIIGTGDMALEEAIIRGGDTSRAKNALRKWLPNFTGSVYGEFDYGDVTTIDLLNELLPSKVKEVRLIIDIMREARANEIKEKLEEVKAKNKLDIKIISTHRESVINGKISQFPISHGRWISDGVYKINNEMDLNKESLASRSHVKYLLKLKTDQGLKDFDRHWDFLKEHKDTKIKLYE